MNRDWHSELRGCFDRRYWAWKLVDFPEATFQRLAAPLAWWSLRLHGERRREVAEAVKWSLLASAELQHTNGSFDQAFPYEQSWGATAFLLPSLVDGIRTVGESLTDRERERMQAMVKLASTFVRRHREAHGRITNHLAGGAWALAVAGEFLGDESCLVASDALLRRVLASQTEEGWFPEYDGADPGYHSLCLYYLAKLWRRTPRKDLWSALDRGVQFASYFVHPDGSFGGEYGVRRTSVCYPGGFALLASDFPLASRIVERTVGAALDGRAASPATIDMGNLAPVLENWCCVVDHYELGRVPLQHLEALPCDRQSLSKDFVAARLMVRGTEARYMICGAATGGAITVFDKQAQSVLMHDAGYVAESAHAKLTTQSASGGGSVESDSSGITVDVPFVAWRDRKATPIQVLALRLFNLTLGRSLFLGNLVKRALVRVLVRGGTVAKARLRRSITCGDRVMVVDTISGLPPGAWTVTGGVRFVSIHMATARYFPVIQVGGVRQAVSNGGSDLSFEWEA
jgi:hypothetical protein